MDKHIESTEKPAEANITNILVSISIYIVIFILGISTVVLTKNILSPQQIATSKPKTTNNQQISNEVKVLDHTNKPPAKALIGTLIATGSARILKRENTEWIATTNNEKIFQEERVILDEGNLNIIFTDHTFVSTDKNISEFDLTNLIPDSFLLTQASGVFTYKTAKTLTIKALEALIRLDQGEVTIELDQETKQVTVKLNEGVAKIALIDQNNTTQVYKLDKNQQAQINSNGKVRISK